MRYQTTGFQVPEKQVSRAGTRGALSTQGQSVFGCLCSQCWERNDVSNRKGLTHRPLPAPISQSHSHGPPPQEPDLPSPSLGLPRCLLLSMKMVCKAQYQDFLGVSLTVWKASKHMKFKLPLSALVNLSFVSLTCGPSAIERRGQGPRSSLWTLRDRTQ